MFFRKDIPGCTARAPARVLRQNSDGRKKRVSFIGSEVVEAGGKTVISARCINASHRLSDFWKYWSTRLAGFYWEPKSRAAHGGP